jgi:hypothetical protein
MPALWFIVFRLRQEAVMISMPLIRALGGAGAFLRVLGGAAAFLAAGGSAQAQCLSCGYETVYRPVVVRQCRPLASQGVVPQVVVPHVVVQPVVTTRIVPVVTYRAVRRVHYVRRVVYSPALVDVEGYDRFGWGYGPGVGHPREFFAGYPLDPSYGLISRE